MTKRQPLFDEYEAALTLDAYLQIVSGKDKAEVRKGLSKTLRQKGVNQGREMTDAYRNLAGMAWQLEYMKCAWTGEYKETMKPSRLFRETVDLYRNDRTKYEEILQKARELSRDPEENFTNVAENEEWEMESFALYKLGGRKKEIIRITITSDSGGWLSYYDELTIEPTGIRYNRNSFIETDTNSARHWAYHTNSTSFKKLFEEVASKIRKVLAIGGYIGIVVEDASRLRITITYSDHKTEEDEYTWGCMPEEYKEFAAVVMKMVPKLEEKPELLKLEDACLV